jgi:pyridoxal phosphate enzyme (YggS family)
VTDKTMGRFLQLPHQSGYWWINALSEDVDLSWISALTRNYALARRRIAQACARAGRDPSSVILVAVTKLASVDQMVEIARLGVLDLGENRVQTLETHRKEFTERSAAAGVDPGTVRWHMIGHLQRNKVKQVLPLVETIQSVDSLRLAQEISTTAGGLGRTVPILMEVNAGQEPQKYGFALEEAVVAAAQIAQLPAIQVCGLMSMAPLTDDTDRIRQAFVRTRELFGQIRSAGAVGESFVHLSMGMTSDFEIAIEEGATIVRIGSLLFTEGASA